MKKDKLSQKEFEAELQKQLEESAKQVATTVFKQDSIIGTPAWYEMLEAAAQFRRNGYKITYWAPNEIIPELDSIASKLVEGETESVVIILGDLRLTKLPSLSCHHYHTIELLTDFPRIKITYTEL